MQEEAAMLEMSFKKLVFNKRLFFPTHPCFLVCKNTFLSLLCHFFVSLLCYIFGFESVFYIYKFENFLKKYFGLDNLKVSIRFGNS